MRFAVIGKSDRLTSWVIFLRQKTQVRIHRASNGDRFLTLFSQSFSERGKFWIIDIYNSNAGRRKNPKKQPCFCVKIGLKARVIIQMILREICEPCRPKARAVKAALGQSVA